jgi:uncharacterized protein
MDAKRKEADRWLRQGKRDLDNARTSCRSGDHEWDWNQVCRNDLRGGEADVEGLRARVRDLADELRSRFGASLVLLFGSLARGDVHEGSDIDLIVVGDFRERFHERPGQVLELTDLPVEALCYTQDEFARMVADGNHFILSALEEGVPV